MVYKDKAFGVPDKSFEFWKANKSHLGKVEEVILSPEEEFSLRVRDEKGTEVWLSGCSTGHRSCWVTSAVLRDCGFATEEIEEAIESDGFGLSR